MRRRQPRVPRTETPERFDPRRMRGELLEAEHLARYWWAGRMACGKRVLDAGCGTAYGSEILSEAGADEVVGIDIDADLIADAKDAVSDAVSLFAGDACDLPFANGSFDLIVCFEVIEHVDNPGAILDELRRVVRPDGVVAVSSPNRAVYPPGNPHHRHELLPAELSSELETRFREVTLVRQHDWIGSAVLKDEDFSGLSDEFQAPTRTVVSRAAGEELYAIALASESKLPAVTPQVVLTNTVDVKRWGQRLGRLEQKAAALEQQREQQRRRRQELQIDVNALGKSLLDVEQRLAREKQRLAMRDSEVRELRAKLEECSAERAEYKRTLMFVQSTRLWRVGVRYWTAKDRLLRRGE